MSCDMCVMQWLTVKIDKSNKLILKEEAVLRVIRSKTKHYVMQKHSYKYSVCCLKTKLRPSFIGSSTVMAKKMLAYTIDLL